MKKLHRKDTSKLDMIGRYYSILSVMDDWNLTKRELQLLSLSSLKGDINNQELRDEFCSLYKSSENTINNIVSKLYKMKLFVKSRNEITVNPHLLFDPSIKMDILITLENEDR